MMVMICFIRLLKHASCARPGSQPQYANTGNQNRQSGQVFSYIISCHTSNTLDADAKGNFMKSVFAAHAIFPEFEFSGVRF